MTFEEIVMRLREAHGDANQLLLITVETALSVYEPRVHEALEAAAIPHWFDDRILAQLLNTDATEATTLMTPLMSLTLVEPFPGHKGWNVHESTRLVLRLKMYREDPKRFLNLSARAAACWPGEDVVSRIEAIYHRLLSEPQQAADELARTYWEWEQSGQREATQALGTALGELNRFPLSKVAAGHVRLIVGWIREDRVPVAESEQYARKALEILKETGPQASCADAHSLLGRILRRKGNLPLALAEFEAGKGILERLAALDPNSSNLQRELSASHLHIGSVYQEQGLHSKALEEYQTYKGIMESVTARDPANMLRQRDLSVVLNYIGSAYQDQGLLSEALKEQRAYLQITERLTELDPANMDWQASVAAAHSHIGSIYQKQGLLSEAFDEYKASLQIMERLTQLDPANLVWQASVAGDHNSLGSVYQAQELLSEALREHQAYQRIMKRLTELDPARLDWQADIAKAHLWIGSVYQAQELFSEALREYQTSKKIMEDLVALDPTHPDWNDSVVTAEEWIGSVVGKLRSSQD